MARIYGDPRIGGDGLIYSRPDNSADGTTWAAFESAEDIRKVNSALEILRTQVQPRKSVDDFFRRLPYHHSFEEVLGDARVWICFDPAGPAAAETKTFYITLGRKTIKAGYWTIAATLLHELAHVNGATDIGNEAEQALLHAGLKAHYVESNAVPPVPRPRPR